MHINNNDKIAHQEDGGKCADSNKKRETKVKEILSFSGKLFLDFEKKNFFPRVLKLGNGGICPHQAWIEV